MARLIAGVLGCFGIGIIIAETTNNFNIINYRINAIIFATLLSVSYLLFQLIIKYYSEKSDAPVYATKNLTRATRIYQICYWIVGLACLAGIPFIWWGVIKRLATLANK